MTVFAAAMDRIFANPSMAVAAVWISATTSEERTVQAIRRAPDRITEFAAARFVSDTVVLDVRVSVSTTTRPQPMPGGFCVTLEELARSVSARS